MGKSTRNQLHSIASDERINLYRKCTSEKTVTQQKQITESLLELMLLKPFQEITVTQLCQHAGVSRRIFYYLFSNLTGALYALIDRKILEVPILEQQGIEEFFNYWKEQKALLEVLEKNAMSGLLMERIVRGDGGTTL